MASKAEKAGIAIGVTLGLIVGWSIPIAIILGMVWVTVNYII